MREVAGYRKKVRRRQATAKVFVYLAAALAVAVLGLIIAYIFVQGLPHISWEFLTTDPKGMGDEGGIFPMIINTLYLVALGLLFATPLSIFAAIYMTEYAKQGRIVRIIRFCVENLAGIPSIIFGLFGYIFFGQMFGFSWSLLNGSLTVALVILPTLIRTTEEALLTVPQSFREGSLALGATKWQTIRKVVLPSASPGIVNGIILSMGRIIGETAALYLTLGNGDRIVTSLMQSARSLSLHLYTLAHEGISREMAFATATVLVLIVVILNVIAGLVGRRIKRYKVEE